VACANFDGPEGYCCAASGYAWLRRDKRSLQYYSQGILDGLLAEMDSRPGFALRASPRQVQALGNDRRVVIPRSLEIVGNDKEKDRF